MDEKSEFRKREREIDPTLEPLWRPPWVLHGKCVGFPKLKPREEEKWRWNFVFIRKPTKRGPFI